jgi:hypothetical protein
MTIAWIVLAALALAALVVAVVRAVRADGYGTRVPPRTPDDAPPRDAFEHFASGPYRLG